MRFRPIFRANDRENIHVDPIIYNIYILYTIREEYLYVLTRTVKKYLLNYLCFSRELLKIFTRHDVFFLDNFNVDQYTIVYMRVFIPRVSMELKSQCVSTKICYN